MLVFLGVLVLKTEILVFLGVLLQQYRRTARFIVVGRRGTSELIVSTIGLRLGLGLDLGFNLHFAVLPSYSFVPLILTTMKRGVG
jgi:hypothetical protein